MAKFAPGTSGNPRGRPRLRHRDALPRDVADDIVKLVVDKARQGDLQAALALLDRCWPVSHERKSNHAS